MSTVTLETHESICSDLRDQLHLLIIENNRLRMAAAVAAEVLEAQARKGAGLEREAAEMLRKALKT